jgi:hypothetical protein
VMATRHGTVSTEILERLMLERQFGLTAAPVLSSERLS